MKLFVLGLIASVAVPLSSFAWNTHEVESVAVVAESVPTPIRETSTPTPTPTVEPVVEAEPVAAPVVAQPAPAPVIVPVVEPEPETTTQYLNRLAKEQGVNVPIRFGTCSIAGIDPATINGCYIPFSHYITITAKGMSYGESWTRCILVHEGRHYFQDISGMYQFLNGYISNHQQLELDAQQFAGC